MKNKSFHSYVPISFSGSFQLTMYSAVGCWLYANALWASEHKVTPSKVELKFVSSNKLLKNYCKCWTYSRENNGEYTINFNPVNLNFSDLGPIVQCL